MRFKPLKSLHLILSLSKDEAKISCFFSILLDICFCWCPFVSELPCEGAAR